MKSLEDIEQKKVVEWARFHELPLFAIPNGGLRNKRVALALKKSGVLAGVPDLFLPIPTNNNHGLFIEMKSPTGRVSDKQKKMIALLKQNGYRCVVCRSHTEAKEEIEKQLNLRQ